MARGTPSVVSGVVASGVVASGVVASGVVASGVVVSDVVVSGGRFADVPNGLAPNVDAGQIAIGRVSNLAAPSQVIDPEWGNHDDRYGWAVDIDGDRMAVSAVNDDGVAVDGGSVYMYVRTDAFSPWDLDAIIVSPTPSAGSHFGDSLGVFGDRVAIVDSATATAATLSELLSVNGLEAPGTTRGTAADPGAAGHSRPAETYGPPPVHVQLTTGDTAIFRAIASRMFGDAFPDVGSVDLAGGT